MPDDCAAVLDGGTDDLSPVQLWDAIMRRYGVAQECEREIARLDATKCPSEKERLQREHAVAVAAAVAGAAHSRGRRCG